MLTEKIAGEMAKEASDDKDCATFTFSTIRLIADMVKEGLYPNGNFSDAECNLWSVFTEVNRAPVHKNFLNHDERSKREI